MQKKNKNNYKILKEDCKWYMAEYIDFGNLSKFITNLKKSHK